MSGQHGSARHQTAGAPLGGGGGQAKDGRARQDDPGRPAGTQRARQHSQAGSPEGKAWRFLIKTVKVAATFCGGIFCKGHHHTGEGENPANARRRCDVCEHQLGWKKPPPPPPRNASGSR